MRNERIFAEGLEDYPGHAEYLAVAERKREEERKRRQAEQTMIRLHSSDRGDYAYAHGD